MRIVARLVGTAAVMALLSYPFWAPQWGQGILGEVAGQPVPVSLIVVGGFFGLVALYCRALQRTLTLIPPDARTAVPASMWWMFAIPFNFTEDFFIVQAVAASLAHDARIPARELRWWSAFGYGWSGLQILSLFPGATGYTAGAVALSLWVMHWVATARINRRLAGPLMAGAFTATR